MIKFWREIIVPWGESDPFGLVYYPRIVAWFNDTEHELFRNIGYPIEQMIEKNKTTFVMGEINFRFIGPAAYGDRIIDFPSQDPTTEVMAKLIHDTLQVKLKEYATNPDARYPLSPEMRVVRVRVWETSSAWAEYSTDE